jgi:transketolase C-terminal domain/subunit
MIAEAGSGLIGGVLSVTDILTALYDAVVDIDPGQPDRIDRDRVVLSKGTARRRCNVGIAEQNMVGVGAGLAACGFVPFVCGASPFLTGRTPQVRSVTLSRQRCQCADSVVKTSRASSWSKSWV